LIEDGAGAPPGGAAETLELIVVPAGTPALKESAATCPLLAAGSANEPPLAGTA
jgi:hypothetical protein